MAIISSSSLTPANSSEAMFTFKQLMVAAGWSVVSSSNGTTLSAGDIIGSASVLNNNSAYFILKQPLGATGSYGGVRRELGFQRGTFGSQYWVAQYLHTSASTGGNATTMPPGAGSERRWLHGDSANEQILFSTDGTYRWHCLADNAAPYGFWAGAYPSGGGNPTTIIMMDPMTTGTFDANDKDPYVFYVGSIGVFLANNAGQDATNQVNSASYFSSPKAWFAKGQAAQQFRGCGIPHYVWDNAGSQLNAINIGTNVNTVKDDSLPTLWAAPSGKGYKGFSSFIRINSGNRATGDTISTTGTNTRDWLVMRNYTLVWNGTVPTV